MISYDYLCLSCKFTKFYDKFYNISVCTDMPGLICPLCPYERTSQLNLNLTNCLKHIKLFHSHQPYFVPIFVRIMLHIFQLLLVTTMSNFLSFILMTALYLRCILWCTCPDSSSSEFTNTYTFTHKVHTITYTIDLYYFFFRFGPLIQYWTMRYEAKHAYFKSLSQSLGNFIN